MALSIKHEEADRLARELVHLTGETLTEAVVVALSERLARQKAQQDRRPLLVRLATIARHCASLPVRDARSADALLGYDDNGLPT